MCLICVCVGACMITHVDARVRVTQTRLNKVSNQKRQNASPLTEVCIPLPATPIAFRLRGKAFLPNDTGEEEHVVGKQPKPERI